MKKELEQKLFDKYPMFRDRTKSIQESCMPWGIETGPGWYHILDYLCETLARIEERHGVEVIFDQVKEKYGTLRVYYHITYGPRWTPTRQLFPWQLEKRFGWPQRYKWWKPLHLAKRYPKWKLDGKLMTEVFNNGWVSHGGEKMLATERVEREVGLAVQIADAMSEMTCESCGMTGATQNQGGWVSPLCDACRKRRNEPESDEPAQAGLEMNKET